MWVIPVCLWFSVSSRVFMVISHGWPSDTSAPQWVWNSVCHLCLHNSSFTRARNLSPLQSLPFPQLVTTQLRWTLLFFSIFLPDPNIRNLCHNFLPLGRYCRRCFCHVIKAPYSYLWEQNDSVMRGLGEGLGPPMGRAGIWKVPPHTRSCLLLTCAAGLVDWRVSGSF